MKIAPHITDMTICQITESPLLSFNGVILVALTSCVNTVVIGHETCLSDEIDIVLLVLFTALVVVAGFVSFFSKIKSKHFKIS